MTTSSGAFNFAFVAFANGQGQIDAGNISVVQNAPSSNGNNVVLTLDGHSEFFALDHDRIDNSNRGDYHVRAGGATNDAVNGIFIATVASNGVDWGFNDEMEYGSASIGYRDDQSLFVSVNNSKGQEYNTNISAAYFDFTRFLGAWVRNDGRGVVTGGEGASKIHVTKNADFTYTVKIDGVNSAEDGVLLVTGGENKAQYAAARALPDGSGWVIGVHNNTADGYAFENDDFGFTYIPKTDPRAVIGHVLSDGSAPVSSGDYTIEKIGTGQYKLLIAGYTPADGALVLSAEGLDGANMDNVVSYAPSPDGKGWIIQTRDFPTGQLEDAGDSVIPNGLDHMLDPVDQAFLGKSIEDIIASYENAQDKNVLVEAHRSNYYENGAIVRPENSLSAVSHAMSLGADILELDFRHTSDGHWVVMHDDSVNRTTNGSGNVTSMTLEQIRALNLKIENTGALTDEKVPTAEEIFAAVKGKAMIDMDKVAPSDFAALSALAATYGVEKQLIFKTSISSDADIAAVKAALAACAPGTHFMALLAPNTTPEFAEKVFQALHPDAVEFQVNPPADGWSDEPGPFFSDAMKAVFDKYDVRMFMNMEFAGQGNADGSMSGGRGDYVALTRPDLVYGYWANLGVSILQTDELHIAVNYLNTFGYRTPADGHGTDGNDILTGTDAVDEIHGGAGDDIIMGLDANDKLYGDAGDDRILGGDGDDLIDGGDGNDVLIGNDGGNDQILGGNGDDQLDGGAGDDVLTGGNGSDIYKYAAGYGSDTIVEGAGQTGDKDQLDLDDVNLSDVVIHRHGSDIEIQIGNDVITLKDQLAGGGVEVINFADGTSLTGAQLADAAVNRGPVVTSPATTSGDEDSQITGQIAASDADGDQLAFAVKNGFGPAHGALTLDPATGQWAYVPATDYNGSDCFTVIVSDGHGGTVEQLIAISVNPVNDAPVAVDDTGSVKESETKVFNLLANDHDNDGSALSLSGFTVDGVDGISLSPDAAKAAFSIVDGKLSFAPGSLFAGLHDGETATVTLSYTVSDGSHTDTGHFTLTVNGEGEAQNVIIGDQGSNVLLGSDGDDAITAYGGADYAWGRDGADVIDGGAGNDYLFGGIGNDVLNGGEGSDTLFGDAGNDILIGDKGNDRLTGGDGDDTFMFRSGFGHDTVMDFGGHDVIDLSKSDFTDFADLASHLSDTDLGTVLTLDDGSTLTLAHVEKGDLTADHFVFSA